MAALESLARAKVTPFLASVPGCWDSATETRMEMEMVSQTESREGRQDPGSFA